MVTIEDSFIKSKHNTRSMCEDELILTDNYVGVIDGATSQESNFLGNKKSGQWISEIISNSLKNVVSASKDNIVNIINRHICKCYKENGVYDLLKYDPIKRPSASIAVIDFFKKEIIMIGDCQCLIDGKLYRKESYLDVLLSSIRSKINTYYLANGYSVNDIINDDMGRQYILPILEKKKLFQNNLIKNNYTYYVVDGFPVPSEGVITIKITNITKNIILATDGYPKLFNTLKESEKYLQNIIQEDPLCIKKYKSTKGLCADCCSFDDRSYIKISLKK